MSRPPDVPPPPADQAGRPLLRQSVPGDTSAVAGARAAVRALLAEQDPGLDVDVVLLMTSEVVANAVVHGRAPIDLVVMATPTGVRVQVSDAGDGIRPAPPAMPPAAGLESGRGIAVVNGLADRWGSERGAGRTTVWFECDRVSGALPGDSQV